MVSYMSREQERGRTADARSGVFAFGAGAAGDGHRRSAIGARHYAGRSTPSWTSCPRRWRHRLHGYLAIADAFIFFHLPPAFLHCFFLPASEISDPSALTQWRLAFANAAGEAARANAAIRANFIQLLLGWMCLLAILARPRDLASIELART